MKYYIAFLTLFAVGFGHAQNETSFKLGLTLLRGYKHVAPEGHLLSESSEKLCYFDGSKAQQALQACYEYYAQYITNYGDPIYYVTISPNFSQTSNSVELTTQLSVFDTEKNLLQNSSEKQSFKKIAHKNVSARH